MGLSDVIKKTKFKIDLSKYKLNNDEKEEVYNLYNYVIEIFLDKYNKELKENKDINRCRVDNRIIEDLVRIVQLNKSFIINDIVMEYIIVKKNSQTILQFLNNFHLLAQSYSENEHFFFNVSMFIQYIMNRSYEDQEYYERISHNESLSKILVDYLNSISSFKEVNDMEGILELFNYLVGMIYYHEYIKEYPDIVMDIAVYILNHYDEIKEEINNDSAVSDTSFDDNCTRILDNYINKGVKKLS